MEDIIKLRSRGNAEHYLKRINKADNSESKTYVLKTSIPFLRTGKLPNRKDFLDLTGGPMLSVGELLKEAGAVIKSIDFVYNYGYTITFE